MRARKLAGFLIAAALLVSLLCGCAQSSQALEPPPTPMPSGGGNTAAQDNITFPETPDASAGISPTPILAVEPPQDVTWISPGKVMIGNFFPGARAEWPLTIHNGNEWVSTFAIAYRDPSHVDEGYVEAPVWVENWVTIADMTPVLMPMETKDVLVAVSMPEDAISPGQEWEFWISVQDTTQEGLVVTELCSRWLVSQRIE